MGSVLVSLLLRLLRRVQVLLHNSVFRPSIGQLLRWFARLRGYLHLEAANLPPKHDKEIMEDAIMSSTRHTRVCASQLPTSTQTPVCPTSILSSNNAGNAVLDPDTLESPSKAYSDQVCYQATSSSVPFPDTVADTSQALQYLPRSSTSEKFYSPRSLDLSNALGNAVVALAPNESERYERVARMDKIREPEYTIDPLTTSFRTLKPPDRWVSLTHPEGTLYFFDAMRNVLTDAYLYDTEDLAKIEDSANRIFEYIADHQICLPIQSQLVLEIRRSGKCGYYFAEHGRRCVFWLEKFDAIDLGIDEVKVKYTSSHIGNEMLSQYWHHNEMFPHIIKVPRDAIKELSDILFHASGDSLTSQLSTAPFSFEVLQNMRSLVKDAQGQETLDAGAACILYRLLGTFAHERFLNLYGEKVPRLNRDQTIHPERKRTYLIKVLSPLLLFGPDTHIHNLEKMSIDCLINKPSWNSLLAQLTDEWKEFTLYATVLLNANVAFLAIQSVDQIALNGKRSNSQRASYFSIATSLGAIILGLVLARQHHNSLNMTFLANRSVSSIGLETLAVIYSLPYALLLWGMVSFLIAFSLMCCGSADVITIIIISVSWFSLSLLILWTVSTAFERSAYHHPWLVRQWKSTKAFPFRALWKSLKQSLTCTTTQRKRNASLSSTSSSISQA